NGRRRLAGASTSELRDVVEAERSGGDRARSRHTKRVDRDHADVAVDREDQRTPGRGLEPGPMVIRGVVVPDPRVVPADRAGEVVVRRVAEHEPLELRVERVARQGGE